MSHAVSPALPAAVLCRLHLHAVLPALAELSRVSAEARQIAAGWHTSLRLAVTGGPSSQIVPDPSGRLRVWRGGAAPEGAAEAGPRRRADLTLWFASPGQLNRLFQDQPTLPPLPLGKPWHLPGLRAFVALTGLLRRYLEPTPEALRADPAFRRDHLRLSLEVLAGALPVIGTDDPVGRALLGDAPRGTAAIRAPALAFSTLLRWDGHALQTVGPSAAATAAEGPTAAGEPGHGNSGGRGPGPGLRPDVAITFQDEETLAAALAGKLDDIAAVGLGRVAVEGLLPLADVLGVLMNRVDAYLKPAPAAKSTA